MPAFAKSSATGSNGCAHVEVVFHVSTNFHAYLMTHFPMSKWPVMRGYSSSRLTVPLISFLRIDHFGTRKHWDNQSTECVTQLSSSLVLEIGPSH